MDLLPRRCPICRDHTNRGSKRRSAGNSRQNMERVDATCRIRLTMIAGASVCRLDHDFLAPKATSNVCRISMCLSLKGSY